MKLDFEWQGKTYQGWTREKAAEKGVPEAVIAEAENTRRRADISAECRRRIYAAASPETQMNMAAATAVISGKAEADRSAEEAGILNGAGDAIAWVADMRATVVLLADDPARDFTADGEWPELPATAAAMIDNF